MNYSCYCRFEIKFRDGLTQVVSKSKLIPASHLSPGDVVSFSTLGSTYQQGLLLEYDKEYDKFYVARNDGTILRFVAGRKCLREFRFILMNFAYFDTSLCVCPHLRGGGVPRPRSWGGYPIPGLDGGRGGTRGTPLTRSGWGTPQTWDGVPLPDLGQGTPPDLGWGTPHTWDGVPPYLGWGTPHTWDRVHPP